MALIDSLTILKHIETRLLTIKVVNGYNNDVQEVIREQRDRSNYNYPFIFVNDIKDAYLTKICKNLNKKGLRVQIIGEIYDDRRSVDDSLPQLGELLQKFKEDVTKCLTDTADVFFNATDCVLQMIEVDTLEGYVPPNARFICEAIIVHFDSK
ncbi:MAG: hypothetical protein PHX51_08395 [Clostridia bacterium]|nr:hypothetical protein [Clostridia bacterium]